jgi:uncharacterized membrane protein
VLALIEFLLLCASTLLLAGYHLWLYRRTITAPHKTAYGRHKLVRAAWLKHYVGSGHDILVVQTLRNWIMSATFLASTALLLALGLLGVAFTTERLSALAGELNVFGSTAPQILLYKFLLLAVLFISSFFLFSMAIRFLIHAGFQINLPSDASAALERQAVSGDLDKGALLYFLGLRLYYLAIPAAFWLLGPLWLLAAVIALLAILIWLD